MNKSFRNLMTAVVLSLPITAFSVGSALADQRDFTVINNTTAPIRHLKVGPTGEDDWGDDILGQSVLNSGDSALVYFEDEANLCSYDIKAVFDDNREAEAYKINLCETNSYTFTD
ncbi:hypothetical protein [Microcoleus sp. herbarium5]|uniref:hypothetical protein n=1 Tax=Microcoleus sp. herbarium5 TaxID=3055434 RepID=UPI002FD2734E